MSANNSYEKTVVHINNLESIDLVGVVFTPLVGMDAKHNKNLLNMLKKRTGNLILLDAKIPNKNTYSFVGNENVGSAFKLTELLIRNKYKSYMFVTNTENTAVQERRKGFMDALSSYNIAKEIIRLLGADGNSNVVIPAKIIRGRTTQGLTPNKINKWKQNLSIIYYVKRN